MVTLILAGIFGVLSGLAWAFVLEASFSKSILIGLIAGIIIGSYLALLGKDATKRKVATPTETKIANQKIIGKLFGLCIIAAGVTWAIRAIF